MDVINNLEKAGYRACKKIGILYETNSVARIRNYWKRNTTLRRISKRITKIKITEQHKGINIISWCNTIFGKIPTETEFLRKNGQTQKVTEAKRNKERGKGSRRRPRAYKTDVNWETMFEGLRKTWRKLSHNRSKQNRTWKNSLAETRQRRYQTDCIRKQIFESYQKTVPSENSNYLLAVVWRLKIKLFTFYISLRRKSTLVHRSPSTTTIKKRNRSNQQYSARLNRWLDRLAHFDTAFQHIAGSNLKVTNYLCRKTVDGKGSRDRRHERRRTRKILTEHAELNAKYGSLFDSQSHSWEEETEKERKQNRNEIEQKKNQTQTHRTFHNKNNVSKLNAKKKLHLGSLMSTPWNAV